jgi:ABC-2 type transport system ATP-binding protein
MRMSEAPSIPAVTARGLARRYGATIALAGLDLDLPRGRVTALLGPNGAGKSTFVDLVLGRGRPDAGTLTVFGHASGSNAARARTGAMLQSAALSPQLTVREHVELHAGYYGDAYPLDVVLEVTGLAELADRRYGRLSGGQQRRTQFALAIVGQPELLVLDEPTVAMDAESRATLWSIVRGAAAEGAAVLLTTHLLEEAEALADDVALLAGGRLIAHGPPSEMRARVGHRRVRCITSLTTDALRRLPGVRDVQPAGRHRVLQTTAAEDTLRALLAADPRVGDLEVGGASLEDAIQDLVSKEAA